MGGEEAGDALGDPAGGREVEELVGAVGVAAGPSTPVMTNWAAGNIAPSMPMNGIVPPSPIVRAGCAEGRRRRLVEAPSASHGANGGAFQPGADSVVRNVTVAPYGGRR